MSKTAAQAEQVTAALNQFYAKEPTCLWQQTITLDATRLLPARPLKSNDPDASRVMTAAEVKALVDAGLIVPAGERYALTAEGQKAWRAEKSKPGYGNLCYGYWQVEHVGSMTPRHDDLFGDAVEAEFRSVLASPAAWTRLPGMQQAFPLMALEVSRPLPHSATMKHTDTGWQVAVAVVDTALP